MVKFKHQREFDENLKKLLIKFKQCPRLYVFLPAMLNLEAERNDFCHGKLRSKTEQTFVETLNYGDLTFSSDEERIGVDTIMARLQNGHFKATAI